MSEAGTIIKEMACEIIDTAIDQISKASMEPDGELIVEAILRPKGRIVFRRLLNDPFELPRYQTTSASLTAPVDMGRDVTGHRPRCPHPVEPSIDGCELIATNVTSELEPRIIWTWKTPDKLASGA